MRSGFDIQVRRHASGWWDIEWELVSEWGGQVMGHPDKGTISAETLQTAWDRLTETVIGSRKDK